MGKQTHNKKENTGRTLVEMDPSVIFFTHSKIRPQFTGCNKLINDTLQEIISGQTKIDAVPYITVIENFEEVEVQEGKKKKRIEKAPFYFSLNNRRLFLFKTLQNMGHVKTIKVHIKPALAREAERYTRARCVPMARIMGGAGESEAGEPKEEAAQGEATEQNLKAQDKTDAP